MEREEAGEDVERDPHRRVDPVGQGLEPGQREEDHDQREPVEHPLEEEASEGCPDRPPLPLAQGVRAHELPDPGRQHVVRHKADGGRADAAGQRGRRHRGQQDAPSHGADPDVDDRRENETQARAAASRRRPARRRKRPSRRHARPRRWLPRDADPDPRLPLLHGDEPGRDLAHID